jgi:histidyl-tRNA synthetase
VKGFNDYLGEEALKRAEIKKILADAFEKYGFSPIETPLVEYEEFVKGDNDKDESVSDIFRLKDKGNRELALRYEFTFQLKRIMTNKKLPFRRYQIGEVFRDEPVSGNRFRQFVQADVDIVGSSVKDEAEILSLSSEVLKKLGIDFVIYFNNRKLLNEILDGEGIVKNKQEVIREIDKLDKLSEKEVKSNLKKFNAEDIIGILKKPKSYFEKYKSYGEIAMLESYCKNYGVKIEFQPFLARGLSYYNGSVYEIKTSKMKETITAGGSYGFNGVQCTGISFGLDRLASLAKLDIKKDKYLVVSLDRDKESIKLAQRLRSNEEIVSMFYGKPSKALEYANSYNYNKVIFVGEKEVKEKKFNVKDMNSGKESPLKI